MVIDIVDVAVERVVVVEFVANVFVIDIGKVVVVAVVEFVVVKIYIFHFVVVVFVVTAVGVVEFENILRVGLFEVEEDWEIVLHSPCTPPAQRNAFIESVATSWVPSTAQTVAIRRHTPRLILPLFHTSHIYAHLPPLVLLLNSAVQCTLLDGTTHKVGEVVLKSSYNPNEVGNSKIETTYFFSAHQKFKVRWCT